MGTDAPEAEQALPEISILRPGHIFVHISLEILHFIQDRLLNAYLAGTVDDDGFKAKTAELNADTVRVTKEIDAQGNVDLTRGTDVLTVYEWSQKAAKIWRGSNTAVRRQILDSICLNRQVSDVTLVTTNRKPFDFWVERLSF